MLPFSAAAWLLAYIDFFMENPFLNVRCSTEAHKRTVVLSSNLTSEAVTSRLFRLSGNGPLMRKRNKIRLKYSFVVVISHNAQPFRQPEGVKVARANALQLAHGN